MMHNFLQTTKYIWDDNIKITLKVVFGGIGFIRLRIRKSAGCCGYSTEPSVAIKCLRVLDKPNKYHLS